MDEQVSSQKHPRISHAPVDAALPQALNFPKWLEAAKSMPPREPNSADVEAARQTADFSNRRSA